LETGSARIETALRDAGIEVHAVRSLDRSDLRSMPTTRTKRLAFGPDPRAIQIEAELT